MKAIEAHEQLLIFKIGSIACCVAARDVDSIVNAQVLHKLPSQAEFIAGVLQYRDSTVSIVNLFHKFSLETPVSPDDGRFIMAYTRHGVTGFWVDEIVEITNDFEQNWSTPPSFIEDNVFDKTLLWHDRLVLKTDFDRLFSMNNSKAIAEWVNSQKQELDHLQISQISTPESIQISKINENLEKNREQSLMIISELITRGTKFSKPTSSVISDFDNDETIHSISISELNEVEHSIGLENVFEDLDASNDEIVEQADAHNLETGDVKDEATITTLLGSAIEELDGNVSTLIENSGFELEPDDLTDDQPIIKSEDSLLQDQHSYKENVDQIELIFNSKILETDRNLQMAEELEAVVNEEGESQVDKSDTINEHIEKTISDTTFSIKNEDQFDLPLDSPSLITKTNTLIVDSSDDYEEIDAAAFLTSSSAIIPTTSILSGEIIEDNVEESVDKHSLSKVEETEISTVINSQKISELDNEDNLINEKTESVADKGQDSENASSMDEKVAWGSLKFGEKHESMFFIDECDGSDESDDNEEYTSIAENRSESDNIETNKNTNFKNTDIESQIVEYEEAVESYFSIKLSEQVKIYQDSIERQRIAQEKNEFIDSSQEDESVFELKSDILNSSIGSEQSTILLDVVNIQNEDQNSFLFESYVSTILSSSSISEMVEPGENSETQIENSMLTEVENTSGHVNKESDFILSADSTQLFLNTGETTIVNEFVEIDDENENSFMFESEIETADFEIQNSSTLGENFEPRENDSSEYDLDIDTDLPTVLLENRSTVETEEDETKRRTDFNSGNDFSSIFEREKEILASKIQETEVVVPDINSSISLQENSQTLTSFLLEDYVVDSSINNKTSAEDVIITRFPSDVISKTVEVVEEFFPETTIENYERDFSLVSEIDEVITLDSINRELVDDQKVDDRNSSETESDAIEFEKDVEAYFTENISDQISVYVESIERQRLATTIITNSNQTFAVEEVSEVLKDSEIPTISENMKSDISNDNSNIVSIETEFVENFDPLDDSELSGLNTGDFDNILLQSISQFENEKSTITNTVFTSQIDDTKTEKILSSEQNLISTETPTVHVFKAEDSDVAVFENRDVKREAAVKKVLDRIDETHSPKNKNSLFRLVASVLFIATVVFLYEHYELSPSSISTVNIRDLMLLSEEKTQIFKPNNIEPRIEKITLDIETVTEKFGIDASVLATISQHEEMIVIEKQVEKREAIIHQVEVPAVIELSNLSETSLKAVEASPIEESQNTGSVINQSDELMASSVQKSENIDLIVTPLLSQKSEIPTPANNFVAMPKFSVHNVVKGDTLWAIAGNYLHNPFRYPDLARWGNIKNPNLIYPGNKVKYLPPTNESTVKKSNN